MSARINKKFQSKFYTHTLQFRRFQFRSEGHRGNAQAPLVVSLARDRVREMAEVRALADSVRLSDPGFAEDLFAAADRYEHLGI